MTPDLVKHALMLSLALFAIGAVGVFLRRNIITIFMCVELMLNAVNLSFIAFSRSLGTLDAQVLVFFVLTVAAAEAAVGLAIVISMQRHRATLDVDTFSLLKW
jgi:NADH-quinone oxidoreductase subunit K